MREFWFRARRQYWYSLEVRELRLTPASGMAVLVASSELRFTRTARGETVLGVVRVNCACLYLGVASTTARSVGMRQFWFRAQHCLVSSNAGNGRGKTVLVASDESELRFTPAIQHMIRVLVHCATLSMVCKVHVYV